MIESTNSKFDPNRLYKTQTWTRIKGKVLVGVDESDTTFNAVNKTGGEKTHKLTISEIPSHNHYSDDFVTGTGSTWHFGVGKSNATQRMNTSYAGGSGSHNNLQPYITVYMWKRTA